MTFPLDLFITPTQQFRSDGSGMRMLGEAGELMQRERLQKMTLGQAEAHFQQNQGLQRQEAQSLDRYRQDQISARRDAMKDKDEAQREKRISVLLAEFRKTKPFSKERELIKQELTGLGQSVEEGDTELPEPAVPNAAVSPLDIAPSAPQKPMGPAPKVDPKFKAALGAEMSKEDQFGLDAPESPGEPAPMPWGDLGIPGAPPQEQKKRGGKVTVKDGKGNLVMSYDEPVEKEKNRSAMKSILGPIVTGARSSEEKQAAQAALDAAVGASESGGFTIKEAADYGKQVYKDEMGRYKTERRPGAIPTGGGGTSRQEQSRQGGMFKETLDVVKEARMEEAVTKANEASSRADHMEDLLSSDDPFKNRSAMSEHLHNLIGSAQTKTEIDNTLGGAGKGNLLLMRLNEWTDGGRMPEDIRRGLKAAASAARQAAQKRIEEAGQKAYDFIKDSGGLMKPEEREQQAAAARNFLVGKPKGAPAAAKDESAERKALEKKLRDKYGGGG